MAKFKVGDKVRILDGSQFENCFGWVGSMECDIGKVRTISEIMPYGCKSHFYKLSGNEFVWDERGLELGVSADRLRELAAADRDGRVVALPCKVGDLLSKLEKLQNSAADAAETYTTGYRYGHRNGQAELIRYILGIGDGSVAEAEAALKGGDTDV